MARKTPRPRVHLIAHANPATRDIKRLGMPDTATYLRFIRAQLPRTHRLTATPRLFDAAEDQDRGGRRDDAARVRDLQNAMDDPATVAIVAVSGGAYFSRLLPELDFSALIRRHRPLWALGFSEMTGLVNIVSSYRAGRGVYWLCPNYLAWKIKPRRAARAAFAEFWRNLPDFIAEQRPAHAEHLPLGPIRGQLVSGTLRAGNVRLIGGCLSVLAGVLTGGVARRLRPDGRWLVLEDVFEPPYRVDRFLATLKIAGWFERVAGVLVGSFHYKRENRAPAVVELLRYHLPRGRRVPVVVSETVGHTWPIVPLPLNRPLSLRVRGRKVSVHTPWEAR